jgi:hypothetical protein
MNSISFGVTYNDELYYFTVNSTIPADCYGYMLEQGEVSQLDSNWFYVKRNTPLYGAGD